MAFWNKKKEYQIDEDRKNLLEAAHDQLNCIGYYYNIKKPFDLDFYYRQLLKFLYCVAVDEDLIFFFDIEQTVHAFIDEFLTKGFSKAEEAYFLSLKYKEDLCLHYYKSESTFYTYVSNAFIDGEKYRSGYCNFAYACATNSSGLRFFDHDNGVSSIEGYSHKSTYYAKKADKLKTFAIYRNKKLEMEITLNEKDEPIIINEKAKYTIISKDKNHFSAFDKEYIDKLNGKKPNGSFAFFGAKICDLGHGGRFVALYSPNRDKMDQHLCLLALLVIVNLRRIRSA